MTFTDEDFKRLVQALLSRLEAAEKAYLLYRNDPNVKHTPEQVEAGLAWRKACGK